MTAEILIFAEHRDGKLSRSTLQALAAGQEIARSIGGRVVVLIAGSDTSSPASELAKARVEEVLMVNSPELREYTPDGYTLALHSVIDQRKPQFVIFSHTYLVRDFVPKLAAALGRGFVSDCLGYRNEGGKLIFVRQIFQGKFNADVEPLGEPPFLISFQAGSFREDSAEYGEAPAKINSLSVEVPREAIRIRPGERFREARQSVDLSQAGIIVAAGRGIKAQENLELVKKLAEVLGAEVGASRPICDSGWLPMDRQIGSSGQTVAPKLYIALGISGAIQHQVGMKGAKTVVAVNRDREAPIFEIASYGIVGDLFEIVPPLIEEIRKIKGQG
jgi:electron transfer flavoprotein alpha subunit